MKIERTGFLREFETMKEGIIYQSNYHGIQQITFTFFMKDYADLYGCYSDSHATVAKFTVKSKLPF